MPSRSSSKSHSKRSSHGMEHMKSPDVQQHVAHTRSNMHRAVLVFYIAMHSLILYYLYNLEDASCKCIRDWRHNFIKIYSICMIVLSVALMFVDGLIAGPLTLVLFVVQAVNWWAFFTYVGDLNDTKCSCAVNKQPLLNNTMYTLRYVVLTLYILGVLGLIFAMVMLGSVMGAIRNRMH